MPQPTKITSFTPGFRKNKGVVSSCAGKWSWVKHGPSTMKNIITMPEQGSNSGPRNLAVRDRRYAIRFPFAADVSLIDLESGATTDGVTSDISLGGCFVCTSKPLPLKSRVRVKLTRKDQSVDALGVVRVVKPRIGMGVEFLDLEQPSYATLERWIDQIRRER